MKTHLYTAVAAALIAASASAEGYQVNSLSAKQNGMAHTGVAMKLGAESQYFNPAGMGFLDKTLDVTASFTAIFPTCTATLPDGSKYTTDNEASTPINAGMAFNVYDRLKMGVIFYTPYGSGINWGDNWPGAVLNQSVTLKVFTVQPTIAWRPLKNLSVGAGLMLTWGTVNLNKALVSASSMDMAIAAQYAQFGLPNPPSFGDTTPASVNLNGTSQVAVGVNLGAMYDITDRWTVGASFRSKMGMFVKKGQATVTYANEMAQQLLEQKIDVINQANFSAEMPCPWVLAFGVSYKPVDRLIVTADAQLTGWHAYRSLEINFAGTKASAFDQKIEKNYHNSWTYRVGAQYGITDRFDVRAGLMVDTTPVDTDNYNPETPGMTKIEPSVGLSFRPIKNLSIDASFMYVHGCGVNNATGKYEDFILGKIQEFKADYKLHAVVPSIGLSYSF